MKPSERRALKELEAQKIKEEAEAKSEIISDSPQNGESDKPKVKKVKSILDGDVESMRKEGFFQSNVKLITFIICMVVFLGTVTIVPLIHFWGEKTVIRGEVSMKMDDVISISQKKQYISWDDFDSFIYIDQSHGKIRERMYMISDTDFVLMVTGPKSDKKYPDTVVLCDLNNTAYFADLTVDNIQLFLAGASKTPTKYIKTKDVLELSQTSVYLRWSDFADYKYSEKTEAAPDKQSITVIRIYPMEDADFSVWVYGEKVFGEPEKVLLVDDNNHKNFVDISNIKETEAFINKNILDK